MQTLPHSIFAHLRPADQPALWARARRGAWATWTIRVAAAAALAAAGLSGAVAAQPTQDIQVITDQAQRWLEQTVAHVPVAPGVRRQIVVGAPDARLQLAACERLEPFLPPGVQLWGSTRLGVRCLQGPKRWSVFLPVQVQAWGPAWVLKGQVLPGQVLDAQDALRSEVDWAQAHSAVLTETADWVGKTATRLLGPGQALRQDMVRAAQVFAAGAQVRVVAQGSGFAITTQGWAVSPGVVGETARVRTDNGRVLTGLVQGDGSVRLAI